MHHLIRYISQSTLKREFAAGVMLWYLSVGTWLMGRLPVTATVPDAALQTWSGLQAVVFSLAASAFLADFVAKQTNWGGPPANTETTVKAEVTDNAATVTTTSEQKP
jgi:hypothetical protein